MFRLRSIKPEFFDLYQEDNRDALGRARYLVTQNMLDNSTKLMESDNISIHKEL